MPRPRRTTRRNPKQNPRNAGLNRAASMRGNNRNLGQNQPFQGGLVDDNVLQDKSQVEMKLGHKFVNQHRLILLVMYQL